MARDNLLTYTDYNKTFKGYTNAVTFQLGAVIIQKGKPIDLYSIKVTDAQKRYTVTDKEPIRIFENLKEFRTILIGQKLRIYNDHKNFTCKNFKTDIEY